MDEARVYIHAAAAIGPGGVLTPGQRQVQAQDIDADLRPIVKQLLGQSLRQASHFVELATIGAKMCIQRMHERPPAATALYFGTGLGPIRKTESLLDQILPPGNGFAAPFDFINASPNMGAFHAAAAVGLSARNFTVAQDELSFERALDLAISDLRNGSTPAALVGGADENFFPRADYLRRLPLDDNEIMGEGGGWLYLDCQARKARGELLAVETFTVAGPWLDAVADRLSEWPGEPIWLLPGFRLGESEVVALRERLPTLGIQRYLPYCGAFPTAAAFGIAMCLENENTPPGLYVHLGRNRFKNAILVVLRVLSP